MDNSVYEAIKAALATGKNPDDIAADLKKLVARAEKELRPKTPVRDEALKQDILTNAKVNIYDTKLNITRKELKQLIAAYLCQRGVMPDNFVSTYKDYLNIIGDCLDNMVTTLKATRAKEYKGSLSDLLDDDFFLTSLSKGLRNLWR